MNSKLFENSLGFREQAERLPEEEKQKKRPRPNCVSGIPIAEAGRLGTERDCFYK